MGLLDELRELGVDVDEAMKRMNNNTALYEKVLFKFKDLMKNYAASLDSEDSQCDELIEVTHAIKGAAGNLSVVPVYDAYTQIVNLLRAGEMEQAKELIKKIRPVQEEIIKCIEKYK